MHVDVLYKILQHRTTDPLNTGQALKNFSRSITELKDKLIKDDSQQHPEKNAAAAARRTQRSDGASVTVQCCVIMIQQSKVRFQKTRHLMSFELSFFPSSRPVSLKNSWMLHVNISQ